MRIVVRSVLEPAKFPTGSTTKHRGNGPLHHVNLKPVDHVAAEELCSVNVLPRSPFMKKPKRRTRNTKCVHGIYKLMCDICKPPVSQDCCHFWLYNSATGETRCNRCGEVQKGHMTTQQHLRNEILSVLWRYSHEPTLTVLEAVNAAHLAVERIVEILVTNPICGNKRPKK